MANISNRNKEATPFRPSGLIPAGEYTAMINDSFFSEHNSIPDSKLCFVFEIMPEEGRESEFESLNGNIKLYENLYYHTKKAQNMSDSKLAAICTAANERDADESEVLHYIPMKIKVAIKPAVLQNDGKTVKYPPQNVIKEFSCIYNSTSSESRNNHVDDLGLDV